MALHEKNIPYNLVEIDPFSGAVPQSYFKLHPFGQVPALINGNFKIYETVAILNYLDHNFDGPTLTPSDATSAARMAQVISIIDNYGYLPMVRQVFAHRVFRSFEGQAPDETEIEVGLTKAKIVLNTLNDIAIEGFVLNRHTISLADIHLAPIIAYFHHAPEGRALLKQYNALNNWWEFIQKNDSFIATDPRPLLDNTL